MVPQLLLLLLVGACALYYEAGFDHHYIYSSESDILGLHNVTTIVKVSAFLQFNKLYCFTGLTQHCMKKHYVPD